MLLAVNYSPQAAALLERGVVDFDLFKCPPWPEVIRAARRHRPVFVHFDHRAGQGPPEEEAVGETARLLAATATPFANTHLAPLRADLDLAGTGSGDTGTSERAELALARVLPDVERLVGRFGGDRVTVENVPWERRADFPIDRVAADPGLLRRVLERTGARLLLDLAHARLTGEEIGVAARELVAPLSLDRLAELHVTGLGWDGDGRRRDHMPMTGDDWRLLEWALGEIAADRWRRPWALALEYGGVGPVFEWRSEEETLARDLPRLAALLADAGLREPGPRAPSARPSTTAGMASGTSNAR